MAAPTELAEAPAQRAPARAQEPPAGPDPPARGMPAWALALSERMWWSTLLIAGVFCAITFYAHGGLNLESMSVTEVALTLATAVLIAVCALLAPRGLRPYGFWPAGLLLGFAALSALSVAWSVQPDYSWQDAGRVLAYCGVFAGGVALVRCAPRRWPAILGGLALAAVVICAYALATKVFPGRLAANDTYARLNEPFGYWNALGLCAAIGVICCMWLGARRDGHALLRALAYPAVGLLLLTLVLSYSRGALAALALGLLAWFCLVPLRLRGAALLLAGGLGAGAVAGWDFSRHALSAEAVPLAERVTAGHELGALVLTMLVALCACGVAISFLTGRRAPSAIARRRAGTAALAGVGLAVLLFAAALAHSHRGLTGSISHGVSALTNPNAKPPPNTPGRLTAVASVRARYWKEALQVFDAHPLLGAGAEGYRTAHLRYETQTLEVRHAHGFIVQTLADLGLAGLVIVLALLFSWLAAAGRATHPFNRSWTRWRAWRELRSGARPGWRALADREQRAYTPERVAMLSMLCLVLVFGVHSLIDWTWYVPGDACAALLCAGWLAGRGPLRAQDAGDTRELATAPRRSNGLRARVAAAGAPRLAAAAAVLVAGLLVAWSQWQPQRSEEARDQALALVGTHPRAAQAAAERAVSHDPLSVEALFTLAGVQEASGQRTRAQSTLERAVRLQPSNPQSWLTLGRYELTRDPKAAAGELRAAIYLDPESISAEAIAAGQREAIEIHNDYIEALTASAQAPSTSAPLKSARARRARAARGATKAARRLLSPGRPRT